MISEVVGVKVCNFTSSDGNLIVGQSVYHCFKEENVEGVACDKIFLRDDSGFPALKVGDKIDVSYNRRGKIESVSIIQPIKNITLNK